MPKHNTFAGLQDTSKTFVEPLDDQVLVRIVRQVKTENGLDLPASAGQKMPMFRVVAVGPGAMTPEGRRAPMDLEPGDLVMPTNNRGHDIEINGEIFTLTSRNCLGMRYHNVDMALRREGLTHKDLQEAVEEVKTAAKLMDAGSVGSVPGLKGIVGGKGKAHQ